MTPEEAKNKVAQNAGYESWLFLKNKLIMDGFPDAIDPFYDQAMVLYERENRYYDPKGEKTYKDLEGKSFEERMDIRFIGEQPSFGGPSFAWIIHSHIKYGADFGFKLVKKEDGYYLKTYEDSGYSDGKILFGPMDEDAADNLVYCFGATNIHYNDDPS